MPEQKKGTQTMPQKWHMALTDAANFGEKCVAADKDAMTAAWVAKPRTTPEPVGMTRDDYAHGADVHRAIAATYEQTAATDAVAARKADRHHALADAMCAIATRAWTPKKADTAAKAAKAAADAKAAAVAKVMEQLAAAGLTVDDLETQ